VDTGAIIITGETSRKENARQVLHSLSDFAGEFVVATAGPHLESVLAAKGAGALALSQERPLLHMDIGGGTSNLALLQEGKVIRTGCLNVGGRLMKFDQQGTVTYVSPVLRGLTELKAGDRATQTQVLHVAQLLTKALEMAAGLIPGDELLSMLSTAEAGAPFEPAPPGTWVCFSGGAAECIREDKPWICFGDLGPVLGRCIRHSRFQDRYLLGQETIRATVIGAGCHSTQLSGSTVFCRGIDLPVKNLPVVCFSQQEEPDLIRQRCAQQDQIPVLSFPGVSGGYQAVCRIADTLAGLESDPLYVAVEQDMAKALGQALSLRCPNRKILCLDRLHLEEGSYLDVGQPVGPAFPVVIKTLVLAGKSG
jgi:ethanolamine utilization protein EutA